jgi:large subunit ribosomal protein L28
VSRVCPITGRATAFGHNVSHANNKTNRRFLPNLQHVTLFSEKWGNLKVRISTRGMRTLEKNGGLDAYLKKLSKTDAANLIERLKKS